MTADFPVPEQDPAPAGGLRFVDGIDVHVVEEGRGRPLVLVHGFPFSLESFRAVRPALAARHRVLAVDLPGFGGSDRPPAFAYDVMAYAELLSTLLKETGAAPTAAVGHGFGAAVAVAAAVFFPGTIERLVLVSPAVAARSVSWLEQWTIRDGLVGAWLWRRVFTRERLARRLRADMYRDSKVADDAWLERLWRPLARAGGLEAARRVRVTLAGLDPIAELPARLSCPTLIVVGDDDRMLPPDRARALAEEVPGGRLAVVADCGHCPHEERPEAFLDAVFPFLGVGSG